MSCTCKCKGSTRPRDAILKVYNYMLRRQYSKMNDSEIDISHTDIDEFARYVHHCCPCAHIPEYPKYDYSYLQYLWSCAQTLPWWRCSCYDYGYYYPDYGAYSPHYWDCQYPYIST